MRLTQNFALSRDARLQALKNGEEEYYKILYVYNELIVVYISLLTHQLLWSSMERDTCSVVSHQ